MRQRRRRRRRRGRGRRSRRVERVGLARRREWHEIRRQTELFVFLRSGEQFPWNLSRRHRLGCSYTIVVRNSYDALARARPRIKGGIPARSRYADKKRNTNLRDLSRTRGEAACISFFLSLCYPPCLISPWIHRFLRVLVFRFLRKVRKDAAEIADAT